MKLRCPSCGAICSADSFLNDANARETFAIICRLPAPVPKVLLNYLSLFRPVKGTLSWKKTLRLAGEIEVLVTKGYVSRKGLPDRNCPARIWARAMEQMVEQRSFLTLPMPNHNYLKKVAYDMADQADSKNERHEAKPVKRNQIQAPDEGASHLAAAYAAYDSKKSKSDVKAGLNDVGSIVKGME